jgi:hypothetical protein
MVDWEGAEYEEEGQQQVGLYWHPLDILTARQRDYPKLEEQLTWLF